MEPLVTDILYSGHLVKICSPIESPLLCSSPKCGHLAIPYSGQVFWSQQYLDCTIVHSIMRTVGCKLPATATRFSHLTFHHTAFSLISIVLVTSKVIEAFSTTRSKSELQKRGHVVLIEKPECMLPHLLEIQLEASEIQMPPYSRHTYMVPMVSTLERLHCIHVQGRMLFLEHQILYDPT